MPGTEELSEHWPPKLASSKAALEEEDLFKKDKVIGDIINALD